MKVISTRKPRKKEKKGRWELAVCVGYRNGDSKAPIWRFRTVDATCLRQATKILDDWIAEIESTPDDVELAEMTVEQLMARYIEDLKIKETRLSTLGGYVQVVNCRIVPALGDVKVADLTPLMLTDFYRELRMSGGEGGAPLSPGTVRKVASVLGPALRLAASIGVIQSNPHDLADKFTGKKGAKKKGSEVAFSASELDLIVEAAKALTDSPAIKTAILIGAHTGMRRSEVIGLRWRDVDFDASMIHVKQSSYVVNKELSPDGKARQVGDPKTDQSERDIPLLDLLRPHLEQEKARQKTVCGYLGMTFSEDDYVVRGPKCRAVSPDTVTTEFKNFVRSFDPAKVSHEGSFKSMRSGLASYLAWKGVPLTTIQALLGHASLATTLHYYLTNINDEQLKAFQEAMKGGYVL